jgi:hypothetical protein
LFTNRDERGGRAFDDLAAGLETGAISRGKAIKLGGAALVGSALGLFASQNAQAQQQVEPAANKRRKCNRRGGDFCSNRDGCRRGICCGRDRDGGGGRRRDACCGTEECNCCRQNQRCTREGRCR